MLASRGAHRPPAPALALLLFPLLPLAQAACQPCDCRSHDPALPSPDPDTDAPAPDTRDRFRPARMAVEGSFAFDPTSGLAVGWIDEGVAHEPVIHLRFTDARYAASQDPRHRCRLALRPTAPARVELRDFAFTFDDQVEPTSYTHLMLALEAGSFSVMDAPYEDSDGERVAGCLEIENDPERGFSLRFADGSALAWASSNTWGVGIGDVASEVEREVLAYPEESYVRELWDFGLLAGSSARVGTREVDFIAPTGVALAASLSEQGEVVYELGLPVRVPAAAFFDLSNPEADPPRAQIETAAFFAIRFSE